jgi:anti-sigma28 factor (negative regulator of flagellin synthesis)
VTDRVQLSEAARLRQRLRTEIGDPAEIASERVEALQAQVANQTYAPSPRAIAERLLGELAADLLA